MDKGGRKTCLAAANGLHKSRRWLQDFIQKHPYYRLAGRTKLLHSRLTRGAALRCGNEAGLPHLHYGHLLSC